MSRTRFLLLTTLMLVLVACGQLTDPIQRITSPLPPPVVGTAVAGTASVMTVEPVFITAIGPEQGTPETWVEPTQSPIPRLPGGLSPTELKYRVLVDFPDFFFCDPDYYPIARADEMDLARQRFPELQANSEEFSAILTHNNLEGLDTYSDDQKLLIYHDHKKLAAISFEVTSAGYQFQIRVAEAEGNGELISGMVDGRGTITVHKREPTIATCPICLSAGTLIDTPGGPARVQDLRIGMLVWTLDKTGQRVERPLIRVSKTAVPAEYQVVHLVLDDGRSLSASPNHPTADGRTVGGLKPGDHLDGAIVIVTERIHYMDAFTYDILPDGDTGHYWANWILLGSTLHTSSQQE